jgi:hypothetical protein
MARSKANTAEREIALVEWVDSASLAGGSIWKRQDKAKELRPSLGITCGFVISEGETYINIVGHMGEEDEDPDGEEVSGEMSIPKCAILRIKRWKVHTRRKV